MKFSAVITALLASVALAAPTTTGTNDMTVTIDSRQMAALHVLADNMDKLGLNNEEMQRFSTFMNNMNGMVASKRDVQNMQSTQTMDVANALPQDLINFLENLLKNLPKTGSNAVTDLTHTVGDAVGDATDTAKHAVGALTSRSVDGTSFDIQDLLKNIPGLSNLLPQKKKGGLLGGILIPGLL